MPPLPDFSSFSEEYASDAALPDGDMRTAYFRGQRRESIDYARPEELRERIASGETVVSAGFVTPYPPGFPVLVPGQVITEGARLARYRYTALQRKPKEQPLSVLEVKIAGADADQASQGIDRAAIGVRAASITRDVANTPAGHLTATDFAAVADELGVSPQRVALAWLLGLSPTTLVIPGSTRSQTLADSLAAAAVELTDEQREVLDASPSADVSLYPDTNPRAPLP